jgi:hypothetical protein
MEHAVLKTDTGRTGPMLMFYDRNSDPSGCWYVGGSASDASSGPGGQPAGGSPQCALVGRRPHVAWLPARPRPESWGCAQRLRRACRLAAAGSAAMACFAHGAALPGGWGSLGAPRPPSAAARTACQCSPRAVPAAPRARPRRANSRLSNHAGRRLTSRLSALDHGPRLRASAVTAGSVTVSRSAPFGLGLRHPRLVVSGAELGHGASRGLCVSGQSWHP